VTLVFGQSENSVEAPILYDVNGLGILTKADAFDWTTGVAGRQAITFTFTTEEGTNWERLSFEVNGDEVASMDRGETPEGKKVYTFYTKKSDYFYLKGFRDKTIIKN